VLACCACAVGAADRSGPAFALEGGIADRGTYSVSAGVSWPWTWRASRWGGEWTGASEVFLSHWSARRDDGRESRTLLGALPMFRYRFNEGRSDWFAEGGIGVSYMDALYRTENKQFSTQFNFMSVLGTGRSFGAQREHELSLRISHLSNAGIKKPNPGEQFLQLRYARRF